MKRLGTLLATLAFAFGCQEPTPKPTTGSVSGTVTVTGAADNANVLVSFNGRVVATATAGTYAYSGIAPGEYKVSVSRDGYVPAEKTVTIVAGEDTKADFTLSRVNRAPVVASVTANPPTVVRKGKTTLSATATDLDGDTVTFAWTLPTGWTLDPGSLATAAQVTVVAPDTAGVTGSFTIDVADGKGGTGTASVVVSTQANGGPIISSVTALPPSVAKGGTIALAVSAQDPDGDALTYAWSVPAGWTLGADAGTTATVTAPPDAGQVATISVQVKDSTNASATGSVVVSTLSNSAPTISSVTASPSTVAKGGTVALAVAAQDADGDALNYQWTVPSGWTLGANSNGAATVTAPSTPGQVGVITVKVTDINGAFTSGSVSVSTRTNAVPVIGSVTASPSSIAKGGTMALAVSAQDGDGDALSYEWTVPSGWALSPDAGATASLTAPALPGQSGVVSVQVRDNVGGVVSGSVSVSTFANNAPVIASVSAAPSSVAKSGTVALSVNASDSDGDALTYQWTVPSGWTLSADAGVTATLTAPATPSAVGVVSVVVTDSVGATATGSAPVSTLANNAPAIANFSATATSPLPGQTVTLTTSASDADGDTLQYAYVSSNVAWLVTGTGSQVTLTAPQTNASSTTVTVTVTDSVGATTTAQLGFAAASCGLLTMNCDGNPANGCEANLGDDSTCGVCGTACGVGTHCNRAADGSAAVCSAPSTSCSAIQTSAQSIGDGTYWLKPTAASVDYQAYCDMTTAGGGWTTFFASLNGSVNNNLAVTFETVTGPTSNCTDPKNNCLRRMPSVVGTSTEVLASCGNVKASFRTMPIVRNYFVNGTQNTWIPTADPTAISGGANAAQLANIWTGTSATSRGWMLSTRPESPTTTFASAFAGDNSWNYCNGSFDTTSPIRLMYRNKVAALRVQAPVNEVASTPFTVTVTAVDAFNQTVPDYRGTIALTSNVGGATLPANYTFVEGDNGRRTFSVTLTTAGATTLTATDTSVGTLSGTASVNVGAAVGTFASPALSCEEIFQAGASSGSGIYWLRPTGVAQPFQAACDMTTSGGGWTVFYSSLNGLQNTFNHFELTSEDCTDPENRCVRRVPASIAPSSEIAASCGAAVLSFTVPTSVRNFFTSGSQSSWQPLYSQTSLAGGANTAYAPWLWTGSGANRSFIIANNPNNAQTFMGPYAGNYDWARCNGTTSYTAPIRLMYRQRVERLRFDVARNVAPNTPQTAQVVVLDKHGYPVTDYRGTIHFANTGVPGVTLPADYTFVAGDNGAHTFTLGITVPTAGQAKLTVSDTKNAALTVSGTIDATTTQLGSQGNPAASCAAILSAFPTSFDGAYWLTDGMVPYQAYCDMTTSGGGWTLAMKLDGRLSTFIYSANYWTTANTLNPGFLNEDRVEAKFPSFNLLSGTQVLAKVEGGIPGTARSQIFPLPGTQTLLTTFTGGYSATSIGRAGWKTLFGPNTSLQLNCNQEGFNVTGGGQSLRLGLATNNENDCNSDDSRVGIGGEGGNCSTVNGMAVGNTTRCGGDFGDRDAASFAWLFVR